MMFPLKPSFTDGDFPFPAGPESFSAHEMAALAVRTLGVAEPEADTPSHGRVWQLIWSVTPVGEKNTTLW